MRVHETNEDYLSDMVFASAYGKEYTYTPEGLVAREGVAENPSTSNPRAKNPSGAISNLGEVRVSMPTAYATNTVTKADLGYDTKPITNSLKDAANIAQSRLRQYIAGLRS